MFFFSSLFGKTFESPEKYVRIKICTSAPCAEKWISDRFFKDWKRLNDNVSLFFFHQKKVTYDKPLYIAQQVLDNAKTRLYHGYYQQIQKTFAPSTPNGQSRCDLLYCDTGKHTIL